MHRGTTAYPLSAAQRQLWLLQRLQPDSAAYIMPFALRIGGPLRVDALREALTEVVRRHDVLRTRYVDEDGIPVQFVDEPDGPELLVVDVSGHPEPERTRTLRDLATREAGRPFDLTAGPPLRSTVVRMAEDDHALLLTVHHIAFDAVSAGVFFRELNEFYAGRGAELPPPGTQYTEHAAQQDRRSSDVDLRFWQEHLHEVPLMSLPSDRQPPAVRDERGASFRFDLGTDLSAQLTDLAEERETTPFVILLAAFDTVLSRYTDSPDVVVGTSVSTRDRAELSRTIGYFLNTLALRVRVSPNATVRELLERVDEVVFDALDHADTPFDDVVRAVAPKRVGNRTSLTQVRFSALDERHVAEPALQGLRVERLDVATTTSKFDLDVDAALTPDGVRCNVEYSTDLFDEAMVRRMIEHWRQVLRAFVADLDQRVSTIDMLTEAERERALVSWNDTGAGDSDPRCMHELFEAQAARTPESVAVVYGDDQLSYSQLDREANRLAHALRGAGVGPESTVGICLPRSADLVVSMLGVLKAGGAFIPLDPDLPPARLGFMIGDAGASALITVTDMDEVLPRSGPPRLLLDRDRTTWSALPPGPPPSDVSPDNLAAMIYTSGSTGAPKCAMVSHGNFTNYFHAFDRQYDLRGRIRGIIQMAAFSFDIFVADTMRALFVGAQLVVCPKEVLLSPPDLYALMVRSGANMAEFAPSVLRLLLDHLEQTGRTMAFMDVIAAGGDIWYAADYERTQRLCGPDTRLVDTCGTTETGIDNVTFTGDLPSVTIDAVPIGRPLPGTRVYILDRNLRVVPVGVIGELYIGGRGVGRGYAGRPGLTAVRYVADPFGPEQGARLYRTGDLTRYRADGTIEIIGRADSQVKVRGYRIELGEVESVLRTHAQVGEGAVVVRERASGDRALAAFVTPAAGIDVDLADVRNHLRTCLPRYMVPSAFSVLPRMPVNANGKLDRAALPPAMWDDPGSEATAHVPPTTPEEEILATIWEEVLDVPHVGISDDFFELGGHSLVAMRVVARVREALGVELPVMQIFEHPTIEELAKHLVGRDGDTQAAPTVTARPRPEDGAPLSFGQQRLWFVEQYDPGTAAYHMQSVFELRGRLDVAALHRACAAVMNRHEVLRSVFRVSAGTPRQVVLPSSEPDMRFEDVSEAADGRTEADRIVEQERVRTFDLAEGPLVRLAVVRTAHDEHLVAFTMHHIVTDGWSMPIFLAELAEYYTAGLGAALPALPVQYADFAVWQRDRLDDTVVRRLLEQWRAHLAGAPELLDLPLDRPRPVRPSKRGRCLDFTLSPADLTAVERFGRQHGVTLFMTLLTAFQVLLARYCEQDDVVVGTTIANRTQAATQNLIGFFVNTLPLRLDLSDNPTFAVAAGRVREAALYGYAHQELPFERLVEELNPARDPAYQPVVQVMFTLQSNDEETLTLPGIDAVAMPVVTGTSQSDLSMEATKTDSGLVCTLRYSTDLFDNSTIDYMAQDWGTLLLAAVAAPGTPVEHLPARRYAQRPPRQRQAAPASVRESVPRLPTIASTPIERVLVAIWSEVLRTDVTDTSADFFGLGGHSLLAARVTAMIDELLNVPITVRTLFEHSTVGSLAQHLEPQVADQRAADLADALAAIDTMPDNEMRALLGEAE
ncbi:non-ribosomal peptide synthetase [Nocardia spumae]|uniref:non-ribosomal peptide synthetase n=1 Tax=Nocardia spumae TaxID=2887190 RepID=UPI001D14D39B|nr:non-ribosomal peptide synthetase [Nocardia spumae]